MNEDLDRTLVRILQMLHDGTISVDEASKLLEAVADIDVSRPDADTSTVSPGVSAEPPAIPPDLRRFRRLSYIPFAASLAVLALTGWGSYALYDRTEGRITFGFVILLALLVLALLTAVLTLWATRVPWLHVRIRSAPRGDAVHPQGAAGTRIAISLPVPLTLAGWGLRIAHRFVDQDTAGRLDAAAALVRAMRSDAIHPQDLGKPGAEPIMVDVNDEDERVQVYIG